ncbi:MAG TPA: DNA ligase [Methylococcaceae bacterium]|nr:DNA ligase [Methylococcaceae bacterium]HIA45664.1 DNA ligase [Methylococcaceae bacterium]HIN68490.1 DNA ligase [Methylococcales bacterium]HIO44244.1 DNA ligase [Methylococcales bacterium]
MPIYLPANELTDSELEQLIKKANKAYRSGQPIMEDSLYDHQYLAEFRRRYPDHKRFHRVEVEPFFSEQKVKHTKPMLSTDKAYSFEDMKRFFQRVKKAADKIDFNHNVITVCVTAKLDGLAASLDKGVLATRGNGESGTNVTHVFDLGVQHVGGDTGLGELVLTSEYFSTHLKDVFTHPRNFMVGLVGAESLNQHAKAALSAGAAKFVPYTALKNWQGTISELMADLDEICASVKDCGFPTDGAVIDVLNREIQLEMGSTNHHHCYQIAKKDLGERTQTKIEDIFWQTGRTGRVTPVFGVTPVFISGATISRVTGHHAGNILKDNIATGDCIEISRAGEVIPKYERKVSGEGEVLVPMYCPSCDSSLEWENDFLVCYESNCPAQLQASLEHFFKILGNVHLLGPKSIEKIIAFGVNTLEGIYQLEQEELEMMNFGPKQSENIIKELKRSGTEPIEDYRFLAAFGLNRLGLGDSRRLLKHIPLEQLPVMTVPMMVAINGFGEATAETVVRQLVHKWPTIKFLKDKNFTLEKSLVESERVVIQSALVGKKIVFTGTMRQSRRAMQEQAVALGCEIPSSISQLTDYLVCGENVGANKIARAINFSVKVVSESDWESLIDESKE